VQLGNGEAKPLFAFMVKRNPTVLKKSKIKAKRRDFVVWKWESEVIDECFHGKAEPWSLKKGEDNSLDTDVLVKVKRNLVYTLVEQMGIDSVAFTGHLASETL
jgi:hypothetical protein